MAIAACRDFTIAAALWNAAYYTSGHVASAPEPGSYTTRRCWAVLQREVCAQMAQSQLLQLPVWRWASCLTSLCPVLKTAVRMANAC